MMIAQRSNAETQAQAQAQTNDQQDSGAQTQTQAQRPSEVEKKNIFQQKKYATVLYCLSHRKKISDKFFPNKYNINSIS